MRSVPTDSRRFWQGKALARSQLRKQLRIRRFRFVGGAEEKPKVRSDLGDSICSQSPKQISSQISAWKWRFRVQGDHHSFQKKIREGCSSRPHGWQFDSSKLWGFPIILEKDPISFLAAEKLTTKNELSAFPEVAQPDGKEEQGTSQAMKKNLEGSRNKF